jgi:uncharacterized membrane protein YidH (DUF202 family)
MVLQRALSAHSISGTEHLVYNHTITSLCTRRSTRLDQLWLASVCATSRNSLQALRSLSLVYYTDTIVALSDGTYRTSQILTKVQTDRLNLPTHDSLPSESIVMNVVVVSILVVLVAAVSSRRPAVSVNSRHDQRGPIMSKYPMHLYRPTQPFSKP